MAVKKSQGAGAVEARRQLLETHPGISRTRQCKLLGVPRSGSYYKRRTRPEPAGLRAALLELYRLDPCLGLRKLPGMLERDYGIRAGSKLIARVRREMELRTIYRHPATSRPTAPGGGKGKEGKKHAYLLKKTPPAEVDDAWTSDITYLQIGRRNLYLCCVMDWTSREVLGWELGWSMETGLCTAALEMVLSSGRKPRVFNTDQGSQYTHPRSERRRGIIPMAFLTPGTVCSNLLQLIPDATLYHFGVLTSSMHMAWVRAVCGRLEMRYRYTPSPCTTTTPGPHPRRSRRGR